MTLLIYDDAKARHWAPFSLTRPVGELLFGCSLLREQAEAVWRTPCSGYITHPGLAGFDEEGAPPALDPSTVVDSEARILLNSRVVWEKGSLPNLHEPAVLIVDNDVAGWVLPAGAPWPSEDTLLNGSRTGGPTEVRMPGLFLNEPWDLVAANADAVRRQSESRGLYRLAPVEGVHVLGDEDVFAGSGVSVEPGVVLDVRNGPVVLDDGVTVQGPARLTGPLYVGRESVIFGGFVGTSSIGPRCKVRGEIVDSVLTGFSNKAHDGHLGHALLGRWVNLGAMTTNSDLKNTYGDVRVDRGHGPEPTGQKKVGCFLGDHVRTGIGTMIGTGAVFGAGSTVFGASAPTFVPPFSWSDDSALSDYRLTGFLDTARTVMARRDHVLSDSMAELFQRAWSQSAEARRSRGVTP